MALHASHKWECNNYKAELYSNLLQAQYSDSFHKKEFTYLELGPTEDRNQLNHKVNALPID